MTSHQFDIDDLIAHTLPSSSSSSPSLQSALIKGSYRELRVWQQAVVIATRILGDVELQASTNQDARKLPFARHAFTVAPLIAPCLARSNIHYGIASTPNVDTAYRLHRYDKAIGETQQALLYAVEIDSTLALLVATPAANAD